MKVPLPDEIRDIVSGIRSLQKRYADTGLAFTPDGKFVGDLGEAIAAENFGITLKPAIHTDGKAPDGRAVQIKTTGRKKGAIYFRDTKSPDGEPVHLIAIYIDWANDEAEIVFNGPEGNVRPKGFQSGKQKAVSLSTLRREAANLRDSEQLPSISTNEG